MASYEAEIKYVLGHAQDVDEQLTRAAGSEGERAEYSDHYFTHVMAVPPGSSRELRVRKITTDQTAKALLTFKDVVVDTRTASKQEHELEVEDDESMIDVLQAMGFQPDIALKKLCTNWNIFWQGFAMLATKVSVPELTKQYLEIETLVKDSSDVPGALSSIRGFAATLGLNTQDETDETYTGAVRMAISGREGE